MRVARTHRRNVLKIGPDETRENEAMERLNDNLTMLRDLRDRLSAMLARVKTDPELRDSGELVHVTGELINTLGAEIQTLERAISEIKRRREEQG